VGDPKLLQLVASEEERQSVGNFTSARGVKRALSNTEVLVGAQNMHWSDAGAWTGEISPLMLKDCGLDLVELGTQGATI
jgi:L-erythrulose 1-phosphate isomerase